ncbi:hypothetical protein NYQ66_18935, partial [Aquibacillus koreensis]|uniref:hypothetical protein n=1 Tax=Aquibacillus koreensis TaxID=279446 RepID=UPI0021A81D42
MIYYHHYFFNCGRLGEEYVRITKAVFNHLKARKTNINGNETDIYSFVTKIQSGIRTGRVPEADCKSELEWYSDRKSARSRLQVRIRVVFGQE